MSTTIKPTTEPIWVIATNNSDVYIPAVVNVGTEFTTGQPVVEEYITRELLLARLDELGMEYGEEDYLAEEVVIVPDWDSFNAAMLVDAEFNTYYGQGLTVAPAITTAIPAALTQVAANKLNAFALTFNGFCTALSVTEQHRENWATIAQSFNLPADFVNVVRGGN